MVSLADSVLAFVTQYGYVAVFVYMALETGFVLHFAPSELVLPAAATVLVRDPLTFALFVLDATAGATVGSVLPYWLGFRGEQALERYGRVVHVSTADLERGQAWFRRWGESSVFWGRMLPVVRGVISFPAGAAEMELRTFLAYTALGSVLFNAALTYLVYTGQGETSLLGLAVAAGQDVLAADVAYVETHVAVVVFLLVLLAAIGAAVWLRRDWIRANPERAKLVGLQAVRAVGVLVGVLLVNGAVLAPERSYALVTWLWNDPAVLVALGLSPAWALLVTGVAFVVVSLVVFEIGRRVPVSGASGLRGVR